MSSSFFTLSRKGEFTCKDRGSKFTGLAYPIESEDEVKARLEEAKKLFPAARHYCYAWRLGADGSKHRSNDDGEPSGSAGRPILGQLIAGKVTNALVIVVRYFGGTLLGVGGLMQAYKTAAAGAIADSGTEERHLMARYVVSFAPSETSQVMYVLRSFEADIQSNTYDDLSRVGFSIKEIHRPALESKFAELYRVTLKLIEGE